MPREIPTCPKKPTPTLQAEHSYEIELITPMFGGGVEPRLNDPSFPIRPTAIRGQLQFWWRATVGAQYATRQELRAVQSAIWGSTERASRVQVLVESAEQDISKPRPCAHYEYKPPQGQRRAKHELIWDEPFSVPKQRPWGTEYLPKDVTYTLFPFQGEKAERVAPGCKPKVQPASAIRTAKFRLILSCHKDVDFAKDVEPSIWAWVNFGGLGSRTRRGCGSIRCTPLAPQDATALATQWKRYMPKLFPSREWPTMAQAILVGGAVADPMQAWEQVIGKFRFFRQGSDFARDPGSPPRRSRFPEADTIRRVTQSWKPGHEPREEIPDGFPRAEFGLPIVFHFKDGKNDAHDSRLLEPSETSLQPFFPEMVGGEPKLDAEGFPVGVTKDRMASPLILKPLQFADGKAVPTLLCLQAELPKRVELQDNKTNQCLTRRRAVPVRDPGFASGNSPIKGRSSDGSALEAFLAFTRSDGFTEVTR